MSLDVYLTDETVKTQPLRWAIFIREDGTNKEISLDEWNAKHAEKGPPALVQVGGESNVVYSRNITHNLTDMADAAGIYKVLWRPDENGITKAAQLIEPLTLGLKRLRSDPDRYKVHNPSNGWGTYDGFVAFVNGWGTYDGFVAFVADYLEACKAHPGATVSVWR